MSRSSLPLSRLLGSTVGLPALLAALDLLSNRILAGRQEIGAASQTRKELALPHDPNLALEEVERGFRHDDGLHGFILSPMIWVGGQE